MLAGMPRAAATRWVIRGGRQGDACATSTAVEPRAQRAGSRTCAFTTAATAFASRALALGESLPMIGRLLGHSAGRDHGPQYAHLARDSVHEAAARDRGQHRGGHPVDRRWCRYASPDPDRHTELPVIPQQRPPDRRELGDADDLDRAEKRRGLAFRGEVLPKRVDGADSMLQVQRAGGGLRAGRRLQPVLVVFQQQTPSVRIGRDQVQRGMFRFVRHRPAPEGRSLENDLPHSAEVVRKNTLSRVSNNCNTKPRQTGLVADRSQ